MLRKNRRCHKDGCRNPTRINSVCAAHAELAACVERELAAEQRGFLQGVKAAAADVQAMADRWGAVPKHVLVQAARSWADGDS